MGSKEYSELKYYFIDESGNPEIFNKRGKVIVGQPGNSRYFILGFLDVGNPRLLRNELRALRKGLLGDPYFKNIPSMQPKNKKTAISFHAKDDIPEVRSKVFRLLRSKSDLKFIAVVKDKMKVVQYATERKIMDSHYKYNPNELYDLLTKRLFKNSLHIATEYKICYAIRGEKPRTQAFGECLKIAQHRFMIENNILEASSLMVLPTESAKEPCLQAADYFLWAIQRLYEKEDIRYIEYMKDMYKLIIDIDDTRTKKYGEYYDTKRNLISLGRIKRGV